LPELCDSGYVFDSREEALGLAETLPNGPACRAWIESAARHDLHIVAGVCERDGDLLYNSAVLFGPHGHIGTYRKVHLWDRETLFFEPGSMGFPVFDTAIGGIAMAICYDSWFPESFRACALQGADIVCLPTNWVPPRGQPAEREALANTVLVAAANCNSLFIAAADRTGVERGQAFVGQSLIVGPDGWPLAGPPAADEEAIIYAEVDLAQARPKRKRSRYNDIIGDRRPEVYDQALRAANGRPREKQAL